VTTFETRDGLTLSYCVTGNGPLLVCQSGGPGRASAYLRDLGGLSETRTLVLLDSRGTGASEKPSDPERLRAPLLANDLEDLRAHLGLDTMDLLAHSAGAVVAQLYAVAHPDRIKRLVLVTPSGRLQGVRGQATSRRGMYGVWNDDVAAHAKGADTEMDPVAEASFETAPTPFDTTTLREVEAPVVAIAGGADRVTPKEAAFAIAACFPHARVEVMEGVGHFPWVEAPAAFNALVTTALGGG
jgi:pimeloyl-ACP methyl ester carboxylesterase